MKYGDFSSLVQLGVGLHLGTALLQLYGEIGLQPMLRLIGRIRSLLEGQEDDTKVSLLEDLLQLETDFDIFRIRLFNEYKLMVLINSIFAGILLLVLVWISYAASSPLSAGISVLLVSLCILPAPITLGVLWYEASKELRPLRERAKQLERRTLSVMR